MYDGRRLVDYTPVQCEEVNRTVSDCVAEFLTMLFQVVVSTKEQVILSLDNGAREDETNLSAMTI